MAKTVIVTGAGGNLGAKAVEALATAPWCKKVIGFYSPNRTPPKPVNDKIEVVVADLTDTNGSWREHFEGVDAVVHFAAKNPVPDSTWSEAAASFDMTVNLGLACLEHGVSRYVFCSSNHAMGGYKDGELATAMSPGALREELAPAPGTRWNDGVKDIDSTAYGSSKIMGERFVAGLAAGSNGRLSAVSLRVGWALPGDNDPADISTSGSPSGQSATNAADAEEARTLRWFRNMWLSNGDFEQLVFTSVTASDDGWPEPSVVINGVSANAGSDWSLENGKRFLGYHPQDDLYARIAQ
ncbi:NAD(P)-dependent oxidoreductase [Brucella haematophila]|nr:NAD(P)-dependent oxidoreductase [Brucella haematophila]